MSMVFACLLLFDSGITFGQGGPNELANLDYIVELLDEKEFEVEGHGFIRFRYNKKDFKSVNADVDSSPVNCLDDKEKKATFDVTVKRPGAKRYESVLHKLEIDFPVSGEYRHSDPNEVFYHGFRFLEIENFPCEYLILGNGQLYVKKTVYSKSTFEEVKFRLVGEAEDGFEYSPESGLGLFTSTRSFWEECQQLVPVD